MIHKLDCTHEDARTKAPDRPAADEHLTIADLGYKPPFQVVCEDTGQCFRYWLVDVNGKQLPLLISEELLAACLCLAVNQFEGTVQ